MIITISALILGAFVASLAFRKKDQNVLVHPRAGCPTYQIPIICADCDPLEDEKPRRSVLGAFGKCGQCGSSSFVLASSIYSGWTAPKREEIAPSAVPFDAKTAVQDWKNKKSGQQGWVN